MLTHPPDKQSLILKRHQRNPHNQQHRKPRQSIGTRYYIHFVDVERAGLLPVDGQVGRQRDTKIQKLNQRDNAAHLTVDFTAPIYQGGGEYSRTARPWKPPTVWTIGGVWRPARQLATTAWDQLQTARRRVAAERDAVAGDQAAVRGYSEQHRRHAR